MPALVLRSAPRRVANPKADPRFVAVTEQVKAGANKLKKHAPPAPKLQPSSFKALLLAGNVGQQKQTTTGDVQLAGAGAMQVSVPQDPAEKEAERTAKRILRMPEPRTPDRIDPAAAARTPRSPYLARMASGIVQRELLIARKQEGQPTISSSLAAEISASQSAGSPLPPSTRRFMEPRFGASFDKVRIQTNESAARMSSQLSARAFTVGNQIFFGRGQFQPDSQEGKELIAHELTHTLQQGAVTQRKFEVSQVQTPLVQRGAIDWIKNKIKRGLNWAAERLIPGYTLLNVILGKNVITDESVSRTGVNLIRGYMRLSPIIGSILLNELEETNSLAEAGAWVEDQATKFGINFNDLANRLETMWGEMSVWRGIDYNVEIFKKYLSPVLGPFLAFSGLVMDKVKELRFEAALRLVGATQLLAAMKKDPAAFKRLIDDPKLILKYFMDALKQGFSQFKDNFGTHFKNALFGWLFGKAAEMGIQMPKEFSAAGLFHLIAQLVGATYQQIRVQVAKKLGPRGESIVSTLEKTVDIVKDLVTRGPIALWERVKSFLSDLKEMIFSKISELVTIEIIKAAVLKLVSMLNPVGALVQLVVGIYRVVKFFIDKWETIKQLTNAILDSITNVALGSIAAAAGYIESTMAKGLTLVISFLASILGLGGIVDKVKALIKKISDPVQLAIGKVVGWIVEKGQGLLKKIGGAVLQAGVPNDPAERMRLGLNAAEAAVNALRGPIVPRQLITPVLVVIKTRYAFRRLEPVEQNGEWWVEGDINPRNRKKTQKNVRGISAQQLGAAIEPILERVEREWLAERSATASAAERARFEEARARVEAGGRAHLRRSRGRVELPPLTREQEIQILRMVQRGEIVVQAQSGRTMRAVVRLTGGTEPIGGIWVNVPSNLGRAVVGGARNYLVGIPDHVRRVREEVERDHAVPPEQKEAVTLQRLSADHRRLTAVLEPARRQGMLPARVLAEALAEADRATTAAEVTHGRLAPLAFKDASGETMEDPQNVRRRHIRLGNIIQRLRNGARTFQAGSDVTSQALAALVTAVERWISATFRKSGASPTEQDKERVAAQQNLDSEFLNLLRRIRR